MTSEEIRKKFLEFFEKRGHKILPSTSLIPPENDKSSLFISAGVQPLAPYVLGEPHPAGKRLANIQKCVRAQDIDDVGDKTHDTFFEMMGNWSLGDYFKEDAIKWSYELLTDKKEGMGLNLSRLYITVFGGNDDAPKDTESFEIWKKYMPENRIYFLTWNGKKEPNWWDAGDNGPAGPDTEIFYDLTGKLDDMTKEEYLTADERQDVVELWNNVFMEYEKKDGKVIGKLKNKTVDTGAGLERWAMALQGKNDIFQTDLFESLIKQIESDSNKKYYDVLYQKDFRILADHIRTLTFLIADGILPTGTEKGSVVRKLIRKSLESAQSLNILDKSIESYTKIVIDKYKNQYPKLLDFMKNNLKEGNESSIYGEEVKLRRVNIKGKEALEKFVKENPTTEFLPGTFIWNIHSSIGTSVATLESITRNTWGKEINKIELEKVRKKFSEISKAGMEQKFKGGLAGHSEMEVKYHTATHLLHQALRDVLGKHVEQKGSNITPERLRFDFSHSQKMTEKEKKKVEDIVNQKIKEGLPMNQIILPKEEAEKSGALHFFGEKYGDQVSIYYIGPSLAETYSKEFCGGPHVKNTSELGNFKIVKEEAISAGIRRIKAILK